MSAPDSYDRFVAAAREGPVPDGFSNTVMQSIGHHNEARWGTPALRAAAWIAAVAVLALRVGCALAVFWAP